MRATTLDKGSVWNWSSRIGYLFVLGLNLGSAGCFLKCQVFAHSTVGFLEASVPR
jgi:hypothetical protein